MIGSVTYDEIKKATDVLTYTDTLELAGEPARLRYAVRYVNASGQRAAFSNFLLLEPAAELRSRRPMIATGKEVSEDAITIAWQPPAANIDGSTPVNLLGYNVYRVAESENDARPNADQRFAGFGHTVSATRISSLAKPIVTSCARFRWEPKAAQVESLNSNSISVSPSDMFPPSAPTSITVAAAPGRLSIFFPANPEADIAGYNIYRSTDPDLPKDKWNKLNADAADANNFPG